MVMYDELYHIKLGDKMTEFVYLIIIMFTIGIFCKYFLYIYDRICYLFLETCIKYGNENIQNLISKIWR